MFGFAHLWLEFWHKLLVKHLASNEVKVIEGFFWLFFLKFNQIWKTNYDDPSPTQR